MRSVLALVFMLVAGLALGSLSSGRGSAPVRLADGWLISGDFHVHAFPGDGTLAPAQLRREALRRNLHTFALTNHNQLLAARIAGLYRWQDGPIVIAGQEVTTPAAHIAAVNITEPIDWRGPTARLIDAIHAQGGVAILAHAGRENVRMVGEAAMQRFDAIEIANGPVFERDSSQGYPLYQDILTRRPIAAIGSSDFHYNTPMGVQRTVLIVERLDADAVTAAIRQGRTAVRFTGRWVGDSAVIRAAQGKEPLLFTPRRGLGAPLSTGAALLVWLALLGLLLRSGQRLR